MLATRLLSYYFAVELVFGVPNQFGKGTDEVLREIADILQRGMLRPGVAQAGPPKAVRRAARKAVARRSR